MSSFKNIQVLLTANTSSLKGALTEASAHVKGFDKAVAASNTNVKSSSTLMKVGLAGGAMAAGVGLMYATAKAIEFDSSMRNVNSLLGLSEDALGALQGEVVAMSTRLPQSANTLAEGLYDLASSGFEGADGLAVLENAAQAASAGMTTTEVSAGALAAVLNAYGLEAGAAADVSDVLFQTVNLGVISFDELAGGIGNVVGTAAAAKVQIDEVGAALATMTLTGIGGAEATTSLNAVLQKIIQPSDSLAELLNDLGYESGAAALETDGLYGVMEKLRQATGGNITTLLELFPEIRAARGALALMSNEGQNYAKVSEEIMDKEKRRGATLRTLQEQMKSAKNQGQMLANQINAMAIEVGVRLLPFLIKGIQAMGDFATKAEDGIGALADRAAPGLEALGRVLSDVWELLTEVGKVVMPLVGGFAALGASVAVPVFNLFAETLATISGFIADHPAIVMAVAAAYGIHLAGGIGRVATMLQVQLVMGLMAALTGLERVEAGALRAKAALAAVQLAEGAATLGVLLVLTSALTAYSEGSSEAKRATEELASAQKAMAGGTAEEAKASIARLTAQLEEFDATTERLTAKTGSPLLDSFKNFGDNVKWLVMRDEMEQVREELLRLNQDFAAARTVVAQYLDEMDNGKLDGSISVAADAVDELIAKATEAGIPIEKLAGGLNGVRTELDDLGVGGRKTAAELEQELIASLEAIEDQTVDLEDAIKSLKQAFDNLVGVFMTADEATIAWERAMADMTDTIKKNGDTLSFTTKKGQENRLAIIDGIEALQKKVEADAAAGASSDNLSKTLETGIKRLIDQADAAGMTRKSVEDLLKQYNLTPDMVQTIIQALGTQEAKEKVQQINAELAKVRDKTVTLTVRTTNVNTIRTVYDEANARASGARAVGSRADGGIDLYKFAAGGRLPSQALIHPPTSRLVQWAEPETGGEAFIPLAPGKRRRSLAILDEVARMFGHDLVEAYASGGIRYKVKKGDTLGSIAKRYLGSASRYPEIARANKISNPNRISVGQTLTIPGGKAGAKPLTKEEKKAAEKRAKEAEKKRKEAERKAKERAAAKAKAADEKLQREAHQRELKRMDYVISGRGDGALDRSLSFSGALGAASSRAEVIARTKAERTASASKNPHDRPEDYYKAPVLTGAGLVSSLKSQVSTASKWRSDLTKIAKGAGADVAAALEAMGEQGMKHVEAMAKSNTKTMKDMAAQMRALTYASFASDLEADVRGREQFRAGLMRLIELGDPALAAQISRMGYSAESNAVLQHALGQSSSFRKQLGSTLAKQQDLTDSASADEAFRALAAYHASGGKLGVVGLASKTGIGLADLLGLLERHKGTVFKGLTGQVAADLKLIASGKQPSGLADGGIVLGGQNKGLFYRWAEEGEGGESLIPLSPSKRGRALDLWHRTGRLIGAQPAGAGAGTMTVVEVAPGAVQVNVRVDGSGLSPAQVEAAARRAVDGSMRELVRKIAAGTGRGGR